MTDQRQTPVPTKRYGKASFFAVITTIVGLEVLTWTVLPFVSALLFIVLRLLIGLVATAAVLVFVAACPPRSVAGC